MARTETLVQLTTPLLELLDRAAARRQVSRSQLIRDAVSAYLRADERALHDEQMVQGYGADSQVGSADDDDPTWSDRARRAAWDDLQW